MPLRFARIKYKSHALSFFYKVILVSGHENDSLKKARGWREGGSGWFFENAWYLRHKITSQIICLIFCKKLQKTLDFIKKICYFTYSSNIIRCFIIVSIIMRKEDLFFCFFLSFGHESQKDWFFLTNRNWYEKNIYSLR